MSGQLKASIKFNLIFCFSLVAFSAIFPKSVIADSNNSIKAKDIISKRENISKDKLKVVNEKEGRFLYSGKKVIGVKVIDDEGNIYGAVISSDGLELEYESLMKEDLEAKRSKYGKFNPAFFNMLTREADSKAVKALLLVKMPYYIPVSYPSGQLPDDGKNIKNEQIEELNKKSKDEYISNLKPISDALIEKLKEKGYEVKDSSHLGLLSVEMSFSELKGIQDWDEIYGIADGSTKEKPMLASAIPAAGITAVNSRGFNGTGVTIAEIEFGGLLTTSNPYLPMTGITQDYTYVCQTPFEHATMVAGVLKSINLANKGGANGSSLWASGSCSGNDDELYNRTMAGVSNYGANVANFSWGCDPSSPDCERYPNYYPSLYDGLAFYYNHPSIIVSAGNSDDGQGGIYGTAATYNLITVGSYIDNNNTNVNDDVTSGFSSWMNPTSTHGDREKPDVVAPGSSITTTAVNSNLSSVEGTSFSAPVVTAGSASLMQRSPFLKSEPEALKALLIATARNDVEQNGQIPSGQDSRDGYGGVDFDWADKLLQGQTGGIVTYGDYNCDTSPNPATWYMNIANTQPHRAVFTWRVDPYYPQYSQMPNMDIDISIYDPNNVSVGSSTSFDNNVEAVYFNPTVTGWYRLVATRYRCETPYVYSRFGAAWSQAPINKAQYYNNQTLSGTPVLVRNDDRINFNWGYGSPDPTVLSDHFSARWTKTDIFNAGTYEFTATGDDGIRLFVDGVKILDKWINQGPTTYKVSRDLTNGSHTIIYEYYDNTGGATAKLSYEKITPVVSGGIYRIINQCSGKVMEVAGSSMSDGANVQQMGWTGGNNQKWRIDSLAGGYYKLTAQHSNKALEVYGNSLLDGGNVVQYLWHDGTNQYWSMLNQGAEFSKLLVRHSGKALDVAGSSIADGANIQQWTDNASCAQRWRLERLQ